MSESTTFGAAVSARVGRVPAWTLTAAAGVAYVIYAPPSGDLAAAAYRSDLFGRVGFVVWDNGWYGGHLLPAYSLLAPALGSLIGDQLLTAISMTLLVALFAALLQGLFPGRSARIASLWLALGAAICLLSNRVPFDLGVALGMGALLAGRHARGHTWLVPGALLLSVLCAVASPVAGAFLALALLAWAVGERSRRRLALALAAAALLPIVLLELLFPEGGSEPFVASAFFPALAGVLFLVAIIPSRLRALRIGALLYAAALLGAYLLPSAIGGNAERLGSLFAGPLAACALAGRGRPARRMLLIAAPLLLYWQVHAAVGDFLTAHSDPAVSSSYYAPLLGELRTLGVGYSARPARIEVVPEKTHWEARWVAPHVPLARGWERQLDRLRNGVFYTGSLTPTRYRAWLDEEAVSYVALPDASPDYSGRAEARLLRGDYPGASHRPPGYLREIWHSAHWRLFAVADPGALVQAPATMTALTPTSFTVRAPSAGEFAVRVRFTRYWAISSGDGCVSRARGDWTELRARRPGSLHIVIRLSLSRLFHSGLRCS